MKEEEELKRRILDLANRCYQQNQYTFSGFLNAGEQALLYEMEREISFVPWVLFGGGGGLRETDDSFWIGGNARI